MAKVRRFSISAFMINPFFTAANIEKSNNMNIDKKADFGPRLI